MTDSILGAPGTDAFSHLNAPTYVHAEWHTAVILRWRSMYVAMLTFWYRANTPDVERLRLPRQEGQINSRRSIRQRLGEVHVQPYVALGKAMFPLARLDNSNTNTNINTNGHRGETLTFAQQEKRTPESEGTVTILVLQSGLKDMYPQPGNSFLMVGRDSLTRYAKARCGMEVSTPLKSSSSSTPTIRGFRFSVVCGGVASSPLLSFLFYM